MKHTVISALLVLALTAPAFAQGDNINTNTNTVNVGKLPVQPPQPPKNTVPPKPAPAKVAKPAANTATNAVNTGPVARGGAGGAGGSAQVNTNSSSTGGAGGEGGSGGLGGNATASGGRGGSGGEGGRANAAGGAASANGGTVNVNNAHQRSAASPTAPAIYSNAECANAASGSITTGVFGLAFGATSDNTACNARQDFSILSASDLPNAAAAAMCLGTNKQRIMIQAEGVDCEVLTKGEVKTVKAGGFDVESFCNEPIGDWERAADRLKVCANLR